MRARAVRFIAWVTRNWPRLKATVARVASFLGGIAILHREIYEVEHAEPLLVFLGLWLVGIAPATFFDGLKKLGQEAKGATDAATTGVPSGGEEEPSTNQLKFDGRDA